MRGWFLFYLPFFLLPISAHCQSELGDCKRMFDSVKKFSGKAQYEKAIKKLEAIKVRCPQFTDSADKRLVQIYTDINRAKENEKAAKNSAVREGLIASNRRLAAESRASNGTTSLLLAIEAMKLADSMNEFSIFADNAIRISWELRPLPLGINVFNLIYLNDIYSVNVIEKKCWRITNLVDKSFFENCFDTTITIAKISPDQSIAAFGTASGKLYFYNFQSKQIENATLINGSITYLQFSREKEVLSIVTDSGKVILYDFKNKSIINSYNFAKKFEHVAIDDSLRIFVGHTTDNVVRVADLDSINILKEFSFDKPIYQIALSQDRVHLAINLHDDSVCLFKLNEPNDRKILYHPQGANGIAFQNSEAIYLNTISSDGFIRQWDVTTGVIDKLIDFDSRINQNQFAFSRNGEFIAVGSRDINTRVWGLDKGNLLQIIPDDNNIVDVNLSESGQTLAVHSLTNGIWSIWKIKNEHDKFRIERQFNISALAISPDKNMIASSSLEKSEISFDSSNGKEALLVKSDNYIWNLKYNLDGTRIVTWDFDTIKDEHLSQATLWDSKNGGKIDHFVHKKNITDIEFSPDGKIVATASRDGTVKLWSINDGSFLRLFKYHNAVESISFHPHKFLMALAYDSTVIIIDPKTGTIGDTFKEIGEVINIKFNPDGNNLLTVTREFDGYRFFNKIHIWDIRKNKKIVTKEFSSWFTVGSLEEKAEQIRNIEYNNSGKYILVEALFDRYNRVWQSNFVLNAHTGEEVFHVNSPISKYVVAVFSSEGSFLAVKTATGVDIWDIKNKEKVSNIPFVTNEDGPINFLLNDKYLIVCDGSYLRCVAWRPKDMIEEASSFLDRNFSYDEWLEFMGRKPYTKTDDKLPIHPSVYKH